MGWILFGAGRRLRNGWWMAIFAALFVASRWIYPPLAELLGHAGAGEVGRAWLQAGLVFAVTWLCLRLRRQSLRDAGLGADRRAALELALGLAFGVASVALAVALMAALGGIELQLAAQRSSAQLLRVAALLLAVAAMEELLFRGFLFQRLIDGIGPWPAMLLVSAAFSLGHWTNPQLEGDARIFATIEIALGAWLLGLAWLRTRRLALPVGLHFGWNFAVGPLFGFPLSGFAQPGWWQPRLDGPSWMTGGAFGLEASVCAIVVDLIAIAVVWRWPSRTAPRADDAADATLAASPSRS